MATSDLFRTEAVDHQRQRFHGTVERSLKLGKKVDSTKVEASYRNGVLELVIPFAPEAQPVRLQLKD